jgi:O-phosphoseryl-tRNA(Sec) kinase
MVESGCLVLICGIPGAGKSYLARAIYDHLLRPSKEIRDFFEGTLRYCPTPIMINFDQIERELQVSSIGMTMGESEHNKLLIWHLARLSAYERVDRILSNCGDTRYLVLIDDNFYYRSMRYKFCQLARKHRVGIISIRVDCDVSKAMARNSERESEERVKSEVIERMVRVFEDAEPGSWEKYYTVICVDDRKPLEVQLPWERIVEAWVDPPMMAEDKTAESEMQREKTEKDFLHQLDLQLRHKISAAARSWKERNEMTPDVNTESLKRFMEAINNERKRVLTILRNKGQGIPETSAGNSGDEHCSDKMQPLVVWGALNWRNECEEGRAALRHMLADRFGRNLEQILFETRSSLCEKVGELHG